MAPCLRVNRSELRPGDTKRSTNSLPSGISVKSLPPLQTVLGCTPERNQPASLWRKSAVVLNLFRFRSSWAADSRRCSLSHEAAAFSKRSFAGIRAMLVKRCPGSARSTFSRSSTRPQKVALSGLLPGPFCSHFCMAAASFFTSSFHSVCRRPFICCLADCIAATPLSFTSGASMITWLCRELASVPKSA